MPSVSRPCPKCGAPPRMVPWDETILGWACRSCGIHLYRYATGTELHQIDVPTGGGRYQ